MVVFIYTHVSWLIYVYLIYVLKKDVGYVYFSSRISLLYERERMQVMAGLLSFRLIDAHSDRCRKRKVSENIVDSLPNDSLNEKKLKKSNEFTLNLSVPSAVNDELWMSPGLGAPRRSQSVSSGVDHRRNPVTPAADQWTRSVVQYRNQKSFSFAAAHSKPATNDGSHGCNDIKRKRSLTADIDNCEVNSLGVTSSFSGFRRERKRSVFDNALESDDRHYSARETRSTEFYKKDVAAKNTASYDTYQSSCEKNLKFLSNILNDIVLWLTDLISAIEYKSNRTDGYVAQSNGRRSGRSQLGRHHCRRQNTSNPS
jgi:hypothetical protein